MYNVIAKINKVPKGVDQGLHLQHTEVHKLSNDEDLKSPASTNTTQEATKCRGVDGNVNKKYTPKRIQISVGDANIATTNKDLNEGVKEIEKMKLSIIKRLTTQIIESEKAGKEALVQWGIQMAHIFANVLKPVNN